jgi:hypothetical protein
VKLCHVRLTESIQAKPGRLGTNSPLEHTEYDLTLISNLRSIKVMKKGWDEPVWIPLERVDCFSSLEEALKK